MLGGVKTSMSIGFDGAGPLVSPSGKLVTWGGVLSLDLSESRTTTAQYLEDALSLTDNALLTFSGCAVVSLVLHGLGMALLCIIWVVVWDWVYQTSEKSTNVPTNYWGPFSCRCYSQELSHYTFPEGLYPVSTTGVKTMGSLNQPGASALHTHARWTTTYHCVITVPL